VANLFLFKHIGPFDAQYSTNLIILALLRSRTEKAKKGKKQEGNQRRAETANWRKNEAKKEENKAPGCDVAKVIDTVEQAVSTAKKVYRVIEPVVNAFTKRPQTR
jgi:stalled ribosome alternative rescue factor ArfA